MQRCLNHQEIKAINRNYKDLLVCEKNYGDLKNLYKACTECEQVSFWQKTEFIVPAIAVTFLAGFLAAEALDGP